MRIAIVGSRNFPFPGMVSAFVSSLPLDSVIVSGGARGVDSWAAIAAGKRGLSVVEYFPDWDKYGKSAGFIRNKTIVDNCDRLVAFWDKSSRGTKNSIDLAIKRGIQVDIMTNEQELLDVTGRSADTQ